MTLFKQCLIFLAVIVTLQMVVFAALGLALQDAERSAERLSYSNRIISGRDRVSHCFYEALQSLMMMSLTGNISLAKRLDEISAEAHETLQDLKASRFASDEDQRDLDKIANVSLFVIDELRSVRDTVVQPGTADRYRQAVRFMRLRVNPHIGDLNEAFTSLATRHRRLEKSLSESQNVRELLRTVIGAGFALSIITAFAIVMAFGLGVTNRIKLVADNFRRHAEGATLHPAQSGTDEISTLDKEFHALSRALTEAAAKDKALFANLPVALVVCLEDGTIEQMNPQAEILFARTPLPGINVSTLSADPEEFKQLLSGSEKEGKGVIRSRWLRKDGSSFPAELSISHFNHNGQERLLLALLDVSDREEVEKLKREFVAIVSHDIRSPMTSIKACLSLFGEEVFGKVSDAGKLQLQAAQRETDRLMRLTRDLLDAAKIEAGNISLTKNVCQLSELVVRSLDAVRPEADQAGITLAAQAKDCEFHADADRVMQILINYLSNAIKYSARGTTVTVRAEAVNPHRLRIEVEDQGRGIPESYLSCIFDRFKQVRPDDAKRGTGLGLAICKMLAEAHGGSVGVTSTPGSGSTFWLELPLS